MLVWGRGGSCRINLLVLARFGSDDLSTRQMVMKTIVRSLEISASVNAHQGAVL